MTLALLGVAFVLLMGGLLYVRSQGSVGDAPGLAKARQGRRSLLEDHVRQLADRMVFDRLTVGADGRSAIGYLPRSRRVLFVDSAWIDGPAAQRGELRAFDVGPEDVLDAVVEQQVWTQRSRNGEGAPRVRSVCVKVFVRDLDAPAHLVELLAEDAPLGSEAHLDAVRGASRWEGLIRALAAEAAREAAVAPLMAGMSDEERRKEQAKALAGKVLANRERRAQIDEAAARQVRPTP